MYSELTKNLILRGRATGMIYDIINSLEVNRGPFSANTSVHIYQEWTLDWSSRHLMSCWKTSDINKNCILMIFYEATEYVLI